MRRRFPSPDEPRDWTNLKAYKHATDEEQSQGLLLWRLCQVLPDLVDDLHEVQVRLPELATRALIGEATVDHWQAMAERLDGPVLVLTEALQLCRDRSVVDGETAPTAIELPPSGAATTDEVSDGPDRDGAT
jgi:hypothetical protein